MKRPSWMFGFVLIGLAHPVTAQEPAVFATGAVFASIERGSYITGLVDQVPDQDLNGTTLGGSVGVGTFVDPRWSVRLEAAFPRAIVAGSTTIQQVGPDRSFTRRVRVSERTRSAAFVIGFHTRRHGRVRFTYLGGIAFAQARRVEDFESIFEGPTSRPPESFGTTTVTYGITPTVGMDAVVALTRRLAIVPRIRAQGSAHGLSIRPGVAIQWGFD